jgi:hypothetical protein
MTKEPGPTATVEMTSDMVARLPGFKDKWVWTCWISAHRPSWIGPFDTAQAAIVACDAHFESGHKKIYWPEEVTEALPTISLRGVIRERR